MNYGKAKKNLRIVLKKNRFIHGSLSISNLVCQDQCQEDQYERQGKRQVKGDPI
jgi:hypothetical protein